MDFVSTLYMALDRLGLPTPTSTARLDADPYGELVIAIPSSGGRSTGCVTTVATATAAPTPPVATALEAQLSALGAALVSELFLAALEGQAQSITVG